MLDLPRGAPRDALFSPDGHLVLTLGWEDEARVHKAATGEVVWAVRPDRPLENWSFSPDGLHLGALSGERLVVWDLHTGLATETDLAPLPVLPFALGPGPGQLTHAATSGYLTTLRTSDWQRAWVRLVGGGPIQRLAFDSHGQHLLGEGPEGCRVWEVPSGRLLASSDGRAPAALSPSQLITTKGSGLVEEVNLATRARRRLSFTPAVQALTAEGACVVPLADGLAFHERHGQTAWEVRGHSGVRALALHGGELVAAHSDPYLRSWPEGRHEQLWGGAITCLAAGPAGLAVGTALGEVRLAGRKLSVEGEVRGVFEAGCGRVAVLSGADAVSVWEGDRCLLRHPGCPLMAGRGERIVTWSRTGLDELDLLTLQSRGLAEGPVGTHLTVGDEPGSWWGATGTLVRGPDFSLELPSEVTALAAGARGRWTAATADGQLRLFEGSHEIMSHRLESPAQVLLWTEGALWAGTREGWIHAFGPEPLGWLILFWDREWVAGTAEGWESSPRAGRHMGLWEEGRFVPYEEAPPELPGTARRLRKRL